MCKGKLQTLVQISDEFDVSLDTMLKADMVMIKILTTLKFTKRHLLV